MIGCAFFVSANAWACSNEVAFDVISKPIRDMENGGKTVGIQKSEAFSAMGIFGRLKEDELVDIVFKPDDQNILISFTGRVKSVGLRTLVNILGKTDQSKEILSKIT